MKTLRHLPTAARPDQSETVPESLQAGFFEAFFEKETLAFTSRPAFTDPHDPALGGDATMSIFPGQVVRSVPPSGHAAIQIIDFEGICSGSFLAVEAECYPFSALCNICPAICNLSPEVLGQDRHIFEATGKCEIYMACQPERELPKPRSSDHIKMWRQR